MTAIRIIDDHTELANVGTVTHASIDSYFNNTAWIIVSGSPGGPIPPSARHLKAGSGISFTDGGDDGDFTVAGFNVSNSSDNRVLTSGGTSTTANAEAALTFDGSKLRVGVGGGSLGDILEVVGPSGTVLSVSGSGNLVKVGEISGSPIFSVNSNGAYFVNSAVGSSLTSAGSPYTSFSIDKSLGSAAWIDYRVSSAGGAFRAGTLMCVWDGTNITYTDTSTVDLGGSTQGIKLSASISGQNVIVQSDVTSETWSIKLGARVI